MKAYLIPITEKVWENIQTFKKAKKNPIICVLDAKSFVQMCAPFLLVVNSNQVVAQGETTGAIYHDDMEQLYSCTSTLWPTFTRNEFYEFYKGEKWGYFFEIEGIAFYKKPIILKKPLLKNWAKVTVDLIPRF